MAKKKKSSAKDKLSAGAADIKKAEQELKKQEPVVLIPLDRPVTEIVRDRVTILDGNIGLELSKDTTIEESLAVLDWTTQMSDHVGFMIGDVLNFGEKTWGQKYTAALNQTGRALSTLKGYADASRRIPANKRVASLSFTHHKEVLRLPDDKIEAVLKEVEKQVKKGAGPSTLALRAKVKTMTPRKKKTPKKPSKVAKKKTKPETPPYVPTDDEQAAMDMAEEALNTANEAIKTGNVFKIVAQCDNKEKQRWLDLTEKIRDFWHNLERITGYKD